MDEIRRIERPLFTRPSHRPLPACLVIQRWETKEADVKERFRLYGKLRPFLRVAFMSLRWEPKRKSLRPPDFEEFCKYYWPGGGET